jgi:hypothetical protein
MHEPVSSASTSICASEPLAPDDRTLAIIASTMRSGSTLLKALLQEAPDVSQLSEINFQKFVSTRSQAAMWALDDQPILLLKRPAWYHESRRYPLLPNVHRLRVVALVRDCYDTVESLRRMTFRFAQNIAAPFSNRWLSAHYWANVSTRLADLADRDQDCVRLVRYEDLVSRPVEITAELFSFLGSSQKSGVDSYSPPAGYRWRWGTDDNSPKIRSLTVQKAKSKPIKNLSLQSIIESTPSIVAVRERLGYL